MEKFRYSEQELALIEQSLVPFAVYQFLNKRVCTIAISQGFLDVFGCTDRAKVYELMDNDMYRDTHPDDVARIADAAVTFATKGGEYDVIYRSKVKDEYHIIHAQGKHIMVNGTRLAQVWYTDEGEYCENCEGNGKSKLNQKLTNALQLGGLYHKTTYDYLTGLPNLSYFFEIADRGYETLTKEGKTPVMLFFDLNGMKHFNAKYGLTEGDKLIREFSKLLVMHFTNENCTRFGMDRFCVFTHDENLEARLWQLFSECENMNNGKTLPVRAGIYLSKLGRIGSTFACDRAKMACDKNRSTYVSNFTYFDKEMQLQAQNKLYIIDNLDRALNEGWIEVYYQPIVRAATGQVCDEEALSRWIDPVRGRLTPDQFIPVIENANLIYKLDLYVTEQILKKMKKQEEEGLYVVPISVNLSRSDFDTCDIVKEITRRVDNAGIPHEKLTIEITESVIGSNSDYMKTQIKRFQNFGFNVWMDDFGSGYSSLDVLQEFNFNLIKFDMKFMKQFETNQKSKVILTELIRMAMNLGIETIVEGVETPEQVEFLREVGCTKLQGFHFSKPLPIDEIFERYRSGIGIGFENPKETEYYSKIGKINLYDLSVITNNEGESFQNYFNTLPMIVIEASENEISFVRGNKSYRSFMQKYFPSFADKTKMKLQKSEKDNKIAVFTNAIIKCRDSVKNEIIDVEISDGTGLHIYIGRLAENPVSSLTALVVVVLSID